MNNLADYREYAPPAALKQHLVCFWTQTIPQSCGEYQHRVLPDACVDIVITNDDAPVVVGPWTYAFLASLPAGARLIGARFRPGLAGSILNLSAAELLNRSEPLSTVVSKTRSDRFARVSDEATLYGRMSVLAEALVLEVQSSGSDLEVMAGIDWLAQFPNGRVEELSRYLGISKRQLQRRFTAAVGYGPKMFQEILRFQRTLHCTNQPAAPSGLADLTLADRNLADLAIEAGYSDQAHMTREIRRFSDSLPTELLGSATCTLKMSDLFKTS